MPATVLDRHGHVDYLRGNAMRTILDYRVPLAMRRRSARPPRSIGAPAPAIIHSSVPVNGSLPLLADCAGVTEALGAVDSD